MKTLLRFSGRTVERELTEVRGFHEQRVPGLGKEFIDEFERQCSGSLQILAGGWS